MTPVRQIIPPSWMVDGPATPVMKVLGGYEASPKALFVGGCVRNHMLGEPVNDIDIATTHRPDIVMKMLLENGIRALPTGLEHGTVTAIIDDAHIEITTLRRDIDTDGRHAVISFTDKWEEDAQRRDFTINTLLCSVMGTLFDPTGQGLGHLDSRQIVFVGQPLQRISEDYLRILRFFRFYAQYSGGEIDADGLADCRASANMLTNLSKERITQEMTKIVMAKYGTQALRLMNDAGILKVLGIEKFKDKDFDNLKELQKRYDAEDVLTRFILLAGIKTKKYDSFLVLSNAQKKGIEDICAVYERLRFFGKRKIRELVYRYDNATVLQAYFLKVAVQGNHPDLEIIDLARYWHKPVFTIGGEDLMRKGYSSGPELGKKLKALEEKWIKKDFGALPKY